MNPVDFPQAQRSLGAPPGAEDVTPLRVWSDGKTCISAWMPTEEERQRIAAGEPVYLHVMMGWTMPPVCLEVGSPFINPETLTDSDAEALREIGIAS